MPNVFRRVAQRTMSVSELHLPREFSGVHAFGAIHCVHCTLHLRCIPHSGSGERDDPHESQKNRVLTTAFQNPDRPQRVTYEIRQIER